MMTADNKWGGNPSRSHNLGLLPWNEAGKVNELNVKGIFSINTFILDFEVISHTYIFRNRSQTIIALRF